MPPHTRGITLPGRLVASAVHFKLSVVVQRACDERETAAVKRSLHLRGYFGHSINRSICRSRQFVNILQLILHKTKR